jgi:dTDP-4-amino-4,6-dideoxygalactose transaminase
MKYHAYNQLLKPWIYQFLSRNPWLKLGETHYKPLSGLQAMDKQRLALLSRNINDYLNRKPWQEKAIASIIAESKLQLLDLPNAAGNSGRLLRYPILCESAAKRDRLHNILSAAGLGASTMYQRPLTAINGVAERASWDGALQGAESFSQRLLTLPTHQGVIKADLQSLAQILG